MQLESTKHRLPYLSSADYIIRQAAQIQQMCSKSDSRDVSHAEKFYTARVLLITSSKRRELFSFHGICWLMKNTIGQTYSEQDVGMRFTAKIIRVTVT